jgi:CBS domain-containing protein
MDHPAAATDNVQRLDVFLAGVRPFDELDADAFGELVAAARLESFAAGELIVDAFERPTVELFVVVQGQVGLWNSPNWIDYPAEETLAQGEVFGFSALLTEQPVGPRAVAETDSLVARLPGDQVEPAFRSAGGARFLAEHTTRLLSHPATPPVYNAVEDLIVSIPVAVAPDTPLAEVAQEMTRRDFPCAVVDTGNGHYGLITDAILRRSVLVDGRAMSTPASEVMQFPAASAPPEDSTAEALIHLLDTDSEYLVVVARDGELRGVVAPQDFVVSPTTAGVSLNEQIKRAGSIDELVERAHRVRPMLVDVLAKGLSSSRVIAVYSAIVDTIVRRSIALVFGQHLNLSLDAFTWLSLGSNGRREAVLSSDVDAAVAFSDSVSDSDLPSYLAAFGEVGDVLVRCGLSVDSHGAFPQRAPFARRNREWHQAATEWLSAPREGQGTILACLLVDGRPIHGDPGLPEVTKVFGNFRRHPATVELVLHESLAHRAKYRSLRRSLAGRDQLYDIKNRGLLPIVNIARWAALGVESTELQTTRRLRASAGSEILPDRHADRLIEAFDVLQRLRLRYQLAQVRQGEEPTDSLDRRTLSPIDRTVVARAVREITVVQRRMDGIANNMPAEFWIAPEHR